MFSCKISYTGTHDELISDPEGAYSQLVHLQQGANETKDVHGSNMDKNDTMCDQEQTMTKPSSLRLLMRRSISRGSSSSSRLSFSFSNGIPGPISIHETEERGEEISTENKGKSQEGQEVSIMRLFSLNKPESIVLLLGAIAAAIHGVIFPVVGLILSSAINMFYETPSKLQNDSRLWALLYLGIGIISLLIVPVQNFLFSVAGGKLVQRIRSLTFEKIVHQEISWFDDPANSR